LDLYLLGHERVQRRVSFQLLRELPTHLTEVHKLLVKGHIEVIEGILVDELDVAFAVDDQDARVAPIYQGHQALEGLVESLPHHPRIQQRLYKEVCRESHKGKEQKAYDYRLGSEHKYGDEEGQ